MVKDKKRIFHPEINHSIIISRDESANKIKLSSKGTMSLHSSNFSL